MGGNRRARSPDAVESDTVTSLILSTVGLLLGLLLCTSDGMYTFPETSVFSAYSWPLVGLILHHGDGGDKSPKRLYALLTAWLKLAPSMVYYNTLEKQAIFPPKRRRVLQPISNCFLVRFTLGPRR